MKYIIYKQLGKGSFGNVYLVKDENNNRYAGKLEEIIKDKPSRLKLEYQIYKYVNKHGFIIGIPKMYDFIKLKGYNLLIMELLEKTLDEKFNDCDKKFKLETIFKLGIDMINIIEKLHNCNFIHRDIKPSNFLFKENFNQLVLIDFGLSKKFLSSNKHIKYSNDKAIVGTARYISINVHLNIEPSRRDDLESIAYILIYLMKGKLPWQGLKSKNQIKTIGEKKMSISIQILCNGLPFCISKFLTYCRTLRFDEKPDYNFIRNLFIIEAKNLNIIPKYEWI